jgi:hypothetical protein
MPRGDGTGPAGMGPGTGRRRGGTGCGIGRGGQGRGGGLAAGTGAHCLCPHCGERIVHQPGQPCYEQKCPQCGTPMIRE